MDIKVFPENELRAVLRALRAVAVANHTFTEAERDFVASIAHIHGAAIDVDALEPITLGELARTIEDPHRRKRVVQLAIVMALVEGDPEESSQRAMQAIAAVLDIEDSGLKVLYEMSQGHTMVARMEMLRRLRGFVSEIDGFPGFFKTAIQALGIAGEDPELAARYDALGQKPPGTFGYAVYRHFRDNGFAFPGEKHSFPGAMVFHDVGHVLSGYGVDPQGEVQQAAFQAGYLRKDGFFFLLFGVLQFHLALRITPVAKGYRGLFDVKRVLHAAERGAACKVDLGHGFDLFEHVDKPLTTLRAELGIPVA
jgi:hypothetical protein